MTKKCKVCGAEVSVEDRFCQKCGSSEFIETQVPENEDTGLLNPDTNPYGMQNQSTQQNDFGRGYGFEQPNWPNGQAQQSVQAPVPVKKKKTGLIVGIIVGVVAVGLIILAVIGKVAEKYYQNNKDTQSTVNNSNIEVTEYVDINDDTTIPDSETEENISNGEYTKGSFDGTTYVNEWADLKATIPEGFGDADRTGYASFETSVTDCGLYWIADNTLGYVALSFEKLPAFSNYDEEKYLDACMEQLKRQTMIEYQLPEQYSAKTIAGYNFMSAVCSFNNGYGDFFQTFYARKLDNYMIVVLTASPTEEANDELAGIFKSLDD